VTHARRSVVLARSIAALVVAASVLGPVPSSAQEDDPGDDNDQARSGHAQLDIDIDVLRVEDTEISAALNELEANVEAQREQVEAAEMALFEAELALQEAQQGVDEAQGRLDGISAVADAVVIEAFTNPPTEQALDALSAESLTDAAVKQSILNTQATEDAEKLTEFQEASALLEIQRSNHEEAAAEAAERRADAEAALADLESALSQQAIFIGEVERRLDQRLGEAASLADLDPELAEQLAAREAELAGVLSGMQAEARAQAARERAAQLAQLADANKGYGTIKDPPGGVVSVACPAGGSIRVAGDIAPSVTRLLNDAAADGLTMCGNGFRDPADQIALRRSNCGTSDYAIYQAPSSACSPPTARPGASLHEQALAIDFTCGGGGTVSYGDACYTWLQANAVNYGLYNLPGEPWHYSVDGN
jgi:peptidoglycan hydrolase CwlO-like protein